MKKINAVLFAESWIEEFIRGLAIDQADRDFTINLLRGYFGHLTNFVYLGLTLYSKTIEPISDAPPEHLENRVVDTFKFVPPNEVYRVPMFEFVYNKISFDRCSYFADIFYDELSGLFQFHTEEDERLYTMVNDILEGLIRFIEVSIFSSTTRDYENDLDNYIFLGMLYRQNYLVVFIS